MKWSSFSRQAKARAAAGTAPIRIVQGLDIPIEGEPDQTVTDGPAVRSVALVGRDYVGLRPAMRVEVGDSVKLGQALFADRKRPEILFTAPGNGLVRRIERGARRALSSVVIELTGDEAEHFSAWPADRLAALRRDQVVETLLVSGLWTALRCRPYGGMPDPASYPASIFVTAMASDPLTARAEDVIARASEAFAHGLTVVAQLTEGPVFVCQAAGAELPRSSAGNIRVVEFAGPHPAGLVGTHIHLLDPVSAKKTVWHLGYQDVIAIGKLFTTGRLSVERIAALAGPMVQRPRLIRARLGASTDDLTRDELRDGECRIISGSVLSGRHAWDQLAYLGRYHNQISVIAEARGAQRAGGLMPGRKKAFSAYRLLAPGRQGERRYALTTARHGRRLAMVPLGGFERVMPLDILPTQLLRALLVGDRDMAQGLGCLELEEEDLALCSFVCPSKRDYGPLLRSCLTAIEKDG